MYVWWINCIHIYIYIYIYIHIYIHIYIYMYLKHENMIRTSCTKKLFKWSDITLICAYLPIYLPHFACCVTRCRALLEGWRVLGVPRGWEINVDLSGHLVYVINVWYYIIYDINKYNYDIYIIWMIYDIIYNYVYNVCIYIYTVVKPIIQTIPSLGLLLGIPRYIRIIELIGIGYL